MFWLGLGLGGALVVGCSFVGWGMGLELGCSCGLIDPHAHPHPPPNPTPTPPPTRIKHRSDMDMLITELAAALPIAVLPGADDPANVSLPQQPLHACLFPGAAPYGSESCLGVGGWGWGWGWGRCPMGVSHVMFMGLASVVVVGWGCAVC